MFDDLFFRVLDPLYLGGAGGRNFRIFNRFLTIISISDASREGVQVLFGHQKKHSPPLGSGLP
jgi:hypothetical protein